MKLYCVQGDDFVLFNLLIITVYCLLGSSKQPVFISVGMSHCWEQTCC